uniref:F-BAR domain only protein 2 n=1 Tax=Takifugu rubripes TaxID=31033 RepID=A0A674NX46_TAKRU
EATPGEKNNGFDVLYHNMKHGQISSKELTEFIRERSTIEETYARSMNKLAKTAGNFSQLGTFAPAWEVFKSSTEKLAGCHMELVRKLQELIKDVQKYVEEQAKAHKKTKEEVASTLEAVQNIQTTIQALQKSKEIYNSKTVEQERLRKEGATQRDVDKAGVKAKKATETYKSFVEKYASAKSEFEQKMAETAQKFQDIEENHVLHMKDIIHSYSQSVEETHVQIGEVQNEFTRNIVNTSAESLIQKLSESKGTGKERPGPIEFEECNAAIATEGAKPRRRKPFGIPGQVNDIDILFIFLDTEDEDEPRKFHVEIKPVQPNNGTHQSRATIDELKASIGNIILSPSTSVQLIAPNAEIPRHKPVAVLLANNDLLSLDPFGPTLPGGSSYSVPASTAPNRPTTPLTTGALMPPPRPSSRPKLPTGKLTGINEIVRPFSPPKMSNASPPPTAPLARAESSSSLSSNTSLSAGNTPTVEDDVFMNLPTFEKRCETPAGTSRGPSPVTLASQDALPIAVAFTESVNAYFKGADPTKCIVKITGEMTLSFPMGIIKVFTNNPSPAVLTFKLKNTSRLEQILPNQQLLHSDPSQSDSNSKDFWFNMQALTSYLRKASDQNPSASYYNVDILKYQVQSDGIHSTPLNLTVYWKCTPSTSDLRIDYRYNPESMANPRALTNVQILVPVDGGVTSMQSLPPSIWNSEQSKCLWKLSDISEKSENEGAGTLRAKFELSNGPSTPSTLAVQFLNEGTTLSGADMELQGSGYRLSLNKKRFATGMTDAPSAGHALGDNPPTTHTLLLFPQDDTWQTAEATHHSAPQNKTKTWKKNQQKNRVNLARPSDHSAPSEHRWVCETRISLQENSTEY